MQWVSLQNRLSIHQDQCLFGNRWLPLKTIAFKSNVRLFKTIDRSILPKFYQLSGLLDCPFDHHLLVFPIIFTFPQSLSQQSEAESEINHSNPCLPLLQPTTVLDLGSAISYLFDKSTKSLFHKSTKSFFHKSAKSLFHKAEINHSNPCLPLLQPTTVLDFGNACFYLLDKLKTSFKWGLWKRALLYQISDIWSQYKMIDCHMKKCDQAFRLHSQYFVKNGYQYL